MDRNVRRSDQQRRDKTAGGWLPFGFPPLDTISKNVVGRTRFELVTSSVSGNFRTVLGVCHRRTGSSGEPLTWADILGGSGWVWGRLMALALICGSHGFGLPGRARSSRAVAGSCYLPGLRW